MRERLYNLRVDQLLSVVHQAPGSDAQRHHLVEGQRRGSGGVIPHRLSDAPADAFTQACRQDPRSWVEQSDSEREKKTRKMTKKCLNVDVISHICS